MAERHFGLGLGLGEGFGLGDGDFAVGDLGLGEGLAEGFGLGFAHAASDARRASARRHAIRRQDAIVK